MGEALDLTEDEVRDAITGLADSADSFLTSTSALLVTDGADFIVPTECEGLECVAQGQSITIDGFNLEDHEYQPVMSYGGISFAQSRRVGEEIPVLGRNPTEVLSYGGWLDHHYFGVQTTFDPNTESPDQVALLSYSFGSASGSNPTSGSSSWSGVAIGVNAAQNFQNRSLLTADVTVSIADFMNPMIDVMFDGIKDLRTGEAFTVRGFPVTSVEWEDVMLMDDGSFDQFNNDDKDPDDFSNLQELRNRIAGRFYGPNHEEIGGIFEYATVGGSFGAKRDDQ